MYDHILATARQAACTFLEIDLERRGELHVIALEGSTCPDYIHASFVHVGDELRPIITVIISKSSTKVTRSYT